MIKKYLNEKNREKLSNYKTEAKKNKKKYFRAITLSNEN